MNTMLAAQLNQKHRIGHDVIHLQKNFRSLFACARARGKFIQPDLYQWARRIRH